MRLSDGSGTECGLYDVYFIKDTASEQRECLTRAVNKDRHKRIKHLLKEL